MIENKNRFWKFNFTGTDDHTLYVGVKDSQTEKYYQTKDNQTAKELTDLLNELHEENKQLKKENMEYYHLVNCRNCKYHNYDWGTDGDEFEVCDKGHTERLMYNKFCKEWSSD